jgi:hypothetical protein
MFRGCDLRLVRNGKPIESTKLIQDCRRPAPCIDGPRSVGVLQFCRSLLPPVKRGMAAHGGIPTA